MLKQILATSALIAIVAVSTQSASAAGKLRQLVVEPAGASADPIILKTKKFPTLVAQPGSGIQTPAQTADAGNGNGGGNKAAKFIVAPGQGIPSQTADAGNGNGGGKAAQFVVAPGPGLPTPPDGGNQGNAKQLFPTAGKASGGIATPVKFAEAGSDPIQTGGNKAFPLIASAPEGLTTPADVTADAGNPASPAVDAQPAAPIAPIASGDAGQPADAAQAAPITASATPAAPAVDNPKDLYSLLTGRGYGVEVLKRDAYGNLVFYVSVPGNTQEADLLLVDGTYGKVLKRQHVAAYSHSYERPAPYTPSYVASYAGEENCDYTAGY
jgi:hypothetical protein